MSVSGGLALGNTVLQPLSTDLWWFGGPKILPRLDSQWNKNAQEIVSHVKTYLLDRNLVATKLDTQNDYPIKKEDSIISVTQMEGASLGMKPPH